MRTRIIIPAIAQPDVPELAPPSGARAKLARPQAQAAAGIDEALRRIDEGTYGFCEETGEPISLARLEARYRRDGLSQWERADLDRRFDRLSAQIRYERRDRDGRRW